MEEKKIRSKLSIRGEYVHFTTKRARKHRSLRVFRKISLSSLPPPPKICLSRLRSADGATWCSCFKQSQISYLSADKPVDAFLFCLPDFPDSVTEISCSATMEARLVFSPSPSFLAPREKSFFPPAMLRYSVRYCWRCQYWRQCCQDRKNISYVLRSKIYSLDKRRKDFFTLIGQ